MKIRIGVGAGGSSAPGDALGGLVSRLDGLGFDSVLTGPAIDPLVGLARAAAAVDGPQA